jgi:tetratricopeptide (TPR) repeat protein
VAIVALTLLVYIPAMGGGFLWDDDWLLTDNPHLRNLNGLARIWQFTLGGDKRIPDYFPVTWTSFWIEWQLWGKNPTGYHVTNIALHAANAVLVWLVLARLGVRWAWLAGALFAVHPVNVASVAWIAERKNTLSMLFYLLAWLSYLRFDEKDGWKWYARSLGLFLLALLSKTSVVMLPVVLLLVGWWRRDKVTWRDLLAALPFFAMALVFSIIGILYQTHVVILGAPIHSPREGFFFRLVVAGIAPWFYMLKTVLPYPLAMVYPRWQIDPKGLPFFLPGLAWVGVLALLWRLRRWCKGVLASLVYFVVTLFPVLGFFTMYYNLYSFVADHWLYVSIIGLLALVAGGAEALSRLWSRWAVLGIASVTVVALGVLTWSHNAVYADNIRLWKDNIAKYPNHFMPYFSLGYALDAQGFYDDALANYEKSITLNSGFDKPYVSIGTILAKRQDFLQAAKYFYEAVRISPNLGVARMNLGVMLHLLGRSEEGLHQLQEALRISDYHVGAHVNMAKVLADTGQLNEAVIHARRAVQLDPTDAEARLALAKYLARSGRTEESIAECRKVVNLEPDLVDAHNLLAMQLRATGRSAEAAEHFHKILQMQPNDADTMNNLGIALADQGELKGAQVYFTKALTLQPDNPEFQSNLALILASLGRTHEAIELYRKALKIRPGWPQAITNLACLLASDADPAVRNLPEAIALAKRACELTGDSNPDMLSNLASAYAAAGRYGEATQTATRAMELARAAGNKNVADILAQRIQAWSASQPSTQPSQH